jgi:hypothetical protein
LLFQQRWFHGFPVLSKDSLLMITPWSQVHITWEWLVLIPFLSPEFPVYSAFLNKFCFHTCACVNIMTYIKSFNLLILSIYLILSIFLIFYLLYNHINLLYNIIYLLYIYYKIIYIYYNLIYPIYPTYLTYTIYPIILPSHLHITGTSWTIESGHSASCSACGHSLIKSFANRRDTYTVALCLYYHYMILHDITWYYMIVYTWYDMILHDIIFFLWYYMILSDITWYYMILHYITSIKWIKLILQLYKSLPLSLLIYLNVTSAFVRPRSVWFWVHMLQILHLSKYTIV